MSEKAFLFDMDGTLIDAFGAYEAAFVEAFKSVGWVYKKGMLEPFYGQVDKEILRIMLKKDRVDDEVERLVELKRRHYLKIARDAIKILPCAVEVIKILKDKNVKVAIATSGQRSATEIAVDKLGIRDAVDSVITGTEVKKGKPDPELFFRAAEMMNVLPNQCIVVEDSLHGIEAGKRAGMMTVAVGTGKTSEEELKKARPDVVVDNLCELIPMIEGMVN